MPRRHVLSKKRSALNGGVDVARKWHTTNRAWLRPGRVVGSMSGVVHGFPL